MIAACIWLAIMVAYVYFLYKEGAFRNLRINFLLGFFARKQFVESVPLDTGFVEIRYGFKLFGHRFFYFKVPLDKIESVAWGMGQDHMCAVSISFDHDDPEERQKQEKLGNRRPNLDSCTIGPSMRNEKKTEAFCLAFVDFLYRAGATLVQAEDFPNIWERKSIKRFQ